MNKAISFGILGLTLVTFFFTSLPVPAHCQSSKDWPKIVIIGGAPVGGTGFIFLRLEGRISWELKLDHSK